MANFDYKKDIANFMDKLKQPGRAQEPTEIERVEQNMAQAAAQIQQKFTQLGSMFYRDHLNDTQLNAEYREIVETIKKLDQNHKGFYAHKLRLEGNMMCANCGAVIPYGSVYCAVCGKLASEKAE